MSDVIFLFTKGQAMTDLLEKDTEELDEETEESDLFVFGKKQIVILVVVLAIIAAAVAAAVIKKDILIPGWHSVGENMVYVEFPLSRASGLYSIGGKYYLFKDYGEHELLYGWNKFDGNYFYSDENGVVLTGEQTVDGEKYKFDGSKGLRPEGMYIVGGKLWYYNDHGYTVSGIVEMDGRKFCFSEAGNLKKGLQHIDGKYYYFDNESEEMQFGLVTVGGAVYYFGEDGAALVGEHEIDGKIYVFGEDGKRISEKATEYNDFEEEYEEYGTGEDYEED